MSPFPRPVANTRTGDPEEIYKRKGCRINPRQGGYRSVHYLIRSQITKELVITELQVRTLFEEGWSEIDHQLRYPYDVNNHLLNHYLLLLNRIAGSADEMATYVKSLQSDWKARDKRESESQAAIEMLRRQLQDANIETQETKAALETLTKNIEIALQYDPEFEFATPAIDADHEGWRVHLQEQQKHRHQQIEDVDLKDGSPDQLTDEQPSAAE